MTVRVAVLAPVARYRGMAFTPDAVSETPATATPPGEPPLLRAYFEHREALIRFLARQLQCLATARDLTQEVYLRTLRVQSGENIDNPRAFLFQIAANLTSDHRRVESRRAELLEGMNDLLWGPDEEISPERHVLATDELAHLDRVIERMPADSRQVFALNRFEGLTQKQIAARLGVSVSTVEKHIRIALRCLCDARREYSHDAHTDRGSEGNT